MKQPMERLRKLCLIDGFVLFMSPTVAEPSVDTILLGDAVGDAAEQRALVLGCGAGLLPLRLARAGAVVTAVDVNPMAVALTERNAYANELGKQITATSSDLFNSIDGTYDLIVTNPPQLPTPPGFGRHDWIGQANDGGADGRQVIDRIVDGVAERLNPTGRALLLQLGFIDLDDTLTRAKRAGCRVKVVARGHKTMGLLSYERLRTLKLVTAPSAYDMLVIELGRAG